MTDVDDGHAQETRAFLLTWNPTRWEWPLQQLDDAVKKTAAGLTVRDQWSVGRRRSGIERGDRAFLLRQHSDRGIVASGTFASTIYVDSHWSGTSEQAAYARLNWDVVLFADDRLPIEIIKQNVPDIAWDRLQGSGVRMSPTAARALETLWESHANAVPVNSPEEPVGEETYTEGGVTTVLANRYERDRRARQKCIQHWGTSCSVCDFDFNAVYGKLGQDFIHVHHLRELSTIGEQYVVDPVNDLRPVCPNCHAMLHRKKPALKIAALKRHVHADQRPSLGNGL